MRISNTKHYGDMQQHTVSQTEKREREREKGRRSIPSVSLDPTCALRCEATSFFSLPGTITSATSTINIERDVLKIISV
jgi:hypothetical protein